MNHQTFYFLIVLSVFSCSRREVTLLPEFRQAETVMWEHPDSAFTLLKAMKKPSSSDELNDATWCLLMTQAKDRNYIKHTSDSLITVALNYFEKHGEQQRKAMAYFYAGQVYKDLKQPEAAITWYLKAKEISEKTDNHRLTSLICSNLGMLYAYRRSLKDDAKQELWEAYNYAVMSYDSSRISSSLCTLGRIYGVFGQWDSVVYFYTEAMRMAEQVNNLRSLSNAQSEIALAYEKLGLSKQAIDLLRNSIKIRKGEGFGSPAQSYLSLGNIYRSMNMYDSAIIYFNKATDTDNLYTLRAAYWHLYHLNKDHGKYKEAIGYNELYREYADSIMHLAHSKEIKEIQEKYENEKLANENNLLKIKQENLIKASLLIMIILIITASALIINSQRKLLNKERLLQKIRDELQMHIAKVRENEATIRNNEEMIMSLQTDLSTDQKNRLIEIEKLRQKNYSLQYQNEILEKKVQAYTLTLKENELKITSYNKLAEQIEALTQREKFLRGELGMNVAVLRRLHFSNDPIEPELWPEIIAAINKLNNNFTYRLKEQVPTLSETDLQYCCLIRQELSTSSIANLTAVSPLSVTKRKQRIRDKINQYLSVPLDEIHSLDDYIQEY
jgi:tetratricopeptide (TPR) repeat protein